MVEPNKVIFLWDGPRSWRKEIYPAYKGTRHNPSNDRELVHKQIPIFKSVLHAIGITQIEVEHLEADDLAGIMVEQLKQFSGRTQTLISSDKDWLSLLRENVVQLRGWKGKKCDWWTADRVLKEYGVEPKDIPRYLALVGDTTDNIPNVSRGTGPVKALKIFWNKLQMTPAEQKQYDFNLRITTILRDKSHVKKTDFQQGSKRTEEDWKFFEDTLIDFELFSVWGMRKQIWELGGWGK